MALAGEPTNLKDTRAESEMRRFEIAAATALALALAATPSLALAQADTSRAWTGLDDVRAATGAYHSLERAIEDGFTPFSIDGGLQATCFDGAGGGMGIHYVRGIDDLIDPLAPEALVYEVTDSGEARLVGVEYIVPQEFVEDDQGGVEDLPALHGRHFHKHSSLPVYVLHAWIWQENPAGIFADLNPVVGPCGGMSPPTWGGGQ
jgi:hypothetical protein